MSIKEIVEELDSWMLGITTIRKQKNRIESELNKEKISNEEGKNNSSGIKALAEALKIWSNSSPLKEVRYNLLSENIAQILFTSISGQSKLKCTNANVCRITELIDNPKENGYVLSDLVPFFPLTPFVLRKKLYSLNIIKKNKKNNEDSKAKNYTLKFSTEQLKLIRKKMIEDPEYFGLKGAEEIELSLKINKNDFKKAIEQYQNKLTEESSNIVFTENEINEILKNNSSQISQTDRAFLEWYVGTLASNNQKVVYANYFIKGLLSCINNCNDLYRSHDEALTLSVDNFLETLPKPEQENHVETLMKTVISIINKLPKLSSNIPHNQG